MMSSRLGILFTLCACFNIGSAAQNKAFTVVAYNVENLFDVDGVAIITTTSRTSREILLPTVGASC